MSDLRLPTAPEGPTPHPLHAVIAQPPPEAQLAGFDLVETHQRGGGQASSAGRIVIAPRYARDTAVSLPERRVLKVSRTSSDDPRNPLPIAGAGGALYANEVAVYRLLRPSEFLEAPVC